MSFLSLLRTSVGVDLRKKRICGRNEIPDSEKPKPTSTTCARRMVLSVEQIQDKVPKCPLIIGLYVFHDVLLINYIGYIFPFLREWVASLLK